MYAKDMDLNMRDFNWLVHFGEFSEAMSIFIDHGTKDYMEITFKALEYYREEKKRDDTRIKCLQKQLKNCRKDLFELRKKSGETGSVLEMHMETNADLDEIEIEDYFTN